AAVTAGGVAGRAVAGVGAAGLHRRRTAGAGAVAGPGQRRGHRTRRAGGWGALRAGRVKLAAARAVAEARHAAAGGALDGALALPVGAAGGARLAHPRASDQRAGGAAARAGGQAADALRAEAALAVGRVGATGADRAQTARSAVADVRRRAVGVGGAGRLAG